ncbi:intradiol ring-cleavage dioxygenase [Actinobacteria bacterium OK006]|nr:intradiol ring-cleavage dioxygenase [Actinobacteria bacterium OK006]
MPVRTRNRMPSISCRLAHVGGRPGFLPFGNSGSSTAHCASVRSPRVTNQDHLTFKIHFRHRPYDWAVIDIADSRPGSRQLLIRRNRSSLGGTFAANACAGEKGRTPTSGTDGEVCYTLTSETVEGPYYIDADKIRQDITEDQEGIPLTFKLKVIDAETCRPVRNAAVDIWHCSAVGVYSGYEAMCSGGGRPAPSATPTDTPTGTPPGAPPSRGPGGGGGGHQEPTDDKRYLRGAWRTDRHGCAVPGPSGCAPPVGWSSWTVGTRAWSVWRVAAPLLPY